MRLGQAWRVLLSRKAALVFLVIALAPGTWLRSEVADRYSTQITVTPLAPDLGRADGFEVLGLWQLSALSENFGGYSAMALLDPRIRLYSDKGWLITLNRPDRPDLPDPGVNLRQLHPTGMPPEDLRDIESVTYHHETGQFWLGYENRHTIYRFSIAGEPEAFIRPAYARHWGRNSGIEAMARLADGRFLVLREREGEGYLYHGDPVEGAEPMPFRVAWPEGYSPTDMAELPDGRVMILLRKLVWRLPVFSSRLVIADPDLIDPERPWQVQHVLQVEDLLPRDNYEGLAVEKDSEGDGRDGAVLWLVSDDNLSAFQRTLLARLRWQPESPDSPPAAPAMKPGQ